MNFILLCLKTISDDPSAVSSNDQTEHIPKILDGTFFTIIKKVKEEKNGKTTWKVEVKCKECGEVKRGSKDSTGNFFRHYRSVHPDRVKAAEEYVAQFIKTPNLRKTTPRQPDIRAYAQDISADSVCMNSIEFRLICLYQKISYTTIIELFYAFFYQ